jgi:hypothetical protein
MHWGYGEYMKPVLFFGTFAAGTKKLFASQRLCGATLLAD